MTRLAARAKRYKVSGYEVPLVGIVPVVLLSDLYAEEQIPTPFGATAQPVYRADLLDEVSRSISAIEELIKNYSPTSPDLVDLIYFEAPDDASYQDVYTWEKVRVTVFEDTSIPDLEDDSHETWH